MVGTVSSIAGAVTIQPERITITGRKEPPAPAEVSVRDLQGFRYLGAWSIPKDGWWKSATLPPGLALIAAPAAPTGFSFPRAESAALERTGVQGRRHGASHRRGFPVLSVSSVQSVVRAAGGRSGGNCRRGAELVHPAAGADRRDRRGAGRLFAAVDPRSPPSQAARTPADDLSAWRRDLERLFDRYHSEAHHGGLAQYSGGHPGPVIHL